MRTALDSNIISALWSAEASTPSIRSELRTARSLGSLVICAPVYAELAAHPLEPERFMDRFFSDTGITVEFLLDEDTWRRAAFAFAAHARRRRRSGGTSPKRVLPDFIIASHAFLRADRLFTLDPSRYQQDFPDLRLV